MKSFEFKVFLNPVGYKAIVTDDDVFDLVTEAVFEAFEGDLTPMLRRGEIVIQCSVQDSSLSKAERQVFHVLKKALGDRLEDGGERHRGRRANYRYATSTAGFASA